MVDVFTPPVAALFPYFNLLASSVWKTARRSASGVAVLVRTTSMTSGKSLRRGRCTGSPGQTGLQRQTTEPRNHASRRTGRRAAVEAIWRPHGRAATALWRGLASCPRSPMPTGG